MVEIRRELPRDRAAVRRANEVAFGQPDEADIVDRLRVSCDQYVSFVAEDGGTVVGHILFTPVSLNGVAGMGLAPMAVLPSHQRQGIGSRLVRHGLEHLRHSGCPYVVVVGHSEYYPRFGFEKASRHRLRTPWDAVPDDAFMVVVFQAATLPPEGGVVRYHREFDAQPDHPRPPH